MNGEQRMWLLLPLSLVLGQMFSIQYSLDGRFYVLCYFSAWVLYVVCNVEWETDILLPVDKWNILRLLLRLLLIIGD